MPSREKVKFLLILKKGLTVLLQGNSLPENQKLMDSVINYLRNLLSLSNLSRVDPSSRAISVARGSLLG